MDGWLDAPCSLRAGTCLLAVDIRRTGFRVCVGHSGRCVASVMGACVTSRAGGQGTRHGCLCSHAHTKTAANGRHHAAKTSRRGGSDKKERGVSKKTRKQSQTRGLDSFASAAATLRAFYRQSSKRTTWIETSSWSPFAVGSCAAKQREENRDDTSNTLLAARDHLPSGTGLGHGV